jgi:hypothetical protein
MWCVFLVAISTLTGKPFAPNVSYLGAKQEITKQPNYPKYRMGNRPQCGEDVGIN